MIQIYFDGELINEDYYSSLSNNFELFSSSFSLGTTAANTYNLSIDKSIINKQPSEIVIKDNEILVATLVVDSIEEDDQFYNYTLTDKMVNFEFYYDASQIFKNGSATLLEIVRDICDKAGVSLATEDFREYNKNITWYDNTITAREYLGYIAELNGGYAQMGTDGKLYFIKQKSDSVANISIDDCADFSIGEKHEITRVVYELGTLKYEFGEDSGNTLYINSDNVFITEASEVEAIYNDLAGFTFFNFSTSNCPIDFNIKAGQIITFLDMEGNKYPTIAGYELSFYGNWYGGYELDIATKKQEETQLVGTGEKIKRLQIKVDRDANTITQLVEKTEQIEEKIDNIDTNAVISVDVQYALSSSNTTAPATGWSTTAPEWENDKYMWQKTTTTYADGTTTESAATCISGAKGDTGKDGENGKDGANGTNGADGKDGKDGIGIASIVEEYYLSDSETDQTGGEWKEEQDSWEDGKYIWTRSKIRWTDETITYTTPILANILNDINSNIMAVQETLVEQKITTDGILSTVTETTKKLNNDYLTAEQVNSQIDATKEDVEILKQKQASTELTAEGLQVQIDTINNQGVDKITTSMGYTFNDSGLSINKTNADTGTIVDEAGIQVIDKTGSQDSDLLYAGYVKENGKYPDYVGQTIVATSNLIVKNYLVVGANSRFEDYVNPILGGQGTGVFEI